MWRTAAFCAAAAGAASTADPLLFGTIPSQPLRGGTNAAAGINVAVLAASWALFEPTQGEGDRMYIYELVHEIAALQANNSNLRIVLDPGMQYPPDWVFSLNPHTRFVDQFNNTYANPSQAGMDVPNAAFNADVRTAQSTYLFTLLAALSPGCVAGGGGGGCPIWGVRLGWGWYGELNYPPNAFNGSTNSYWAYDAIAQGQAPSLLPPGVQPCPVPGWLPGQPSPQGEAASFIGWYLGTLQNWHDWQLAYTRSIFNGTIMMLYPSWGVRPGQLAGAIAHDLNGSTPVEVNGELQRGFDFGRYIGGIDVGALSPVVAYTTWFDAAEGNDTSADQTLWSPPHWISYLAAQQGMPAWGENTGHSDNHTMSRCFARIAAFGMDGIVWAFEEDLYATSPGLATIQDYAAAIAAATATRYQSP